MTIDEIVKELEDSKDYPANDPASDEALDGAINTMRKYQKIQNIAENYDKGILEENDGVYAFKQIRKVLEDGNEH